MNILFLGGTRFLGRHLVEAAVNRGHRPTLFNRGFTAPNAFPELEHLRGDRSKDLGSLRGRTWDAVIDTSGYTPRTVSVSVDALRGVVEQYVYISSVMVYAGLDRPVGSFDESAPPLEPEEDLGEEVTGATYGAQKSLCERVLHEGWAGSLCLRPGMIVGENDPTDRLAYWVRRVRRGGAVLAPGPDTSPIQMLDARDLAAWTIQMIEDQCGGTFNAAGLPLTFGDMLGTIAASLDRPLEPVWIDGPALMAAGIRPESDLPLWIPDKPGLNRIDSRAALREGLAVRPFAETIRDFDLWDAARGPVPLWAGMSQEQEAEALLRLRDHP